MVLLIAGPVDLYDALEFLRWAKLTAFFKMNPKP
jgi:hypothetical protein